MPFYSWRQALEQLCCATRAQASGPGLLGPPEAPGSHHAVRLRILGGANGENRVLSRTFGREGEEETSIIMVYRSNGGDADDFDSAFRENDLQTLVRLLDSDQVVELVEPKHPWAEDACTIGALSAMQLALLSSMVAKDDPGLKVEIHDAGAIPPLIRFLRSCQEDRVQAAVVALKYLTDESSQNARAAYREGAMPLLIDHLSSPVAGMRGAAASTLKHICVESEEYCDDFVRLNGMKAFVNQLELVSDPVVVDADLMLEAVWNLEEVTTDDAGNLIEKYGRVANEHGAREKLERLREVGDEEVKGAAEKVLMALVQVE